MGFRDESFFDCNKMRLSLSQSCNITLSPDLRVWDNTIYRILFQNLTLTICSTSQFRIIMLGLYVIGILG